MSEVLQSKWGPCTRLENTKAYVHEMPDGTLLLRSFDTAVAAIRPDGVGYQTDVYWSRSTSYHIKRFWAVYAQRWSRVEPAPQGQFNMALAQLEPGAERLVDKTV